VNLLNEPNGELIEAAKGGESESSDQLYGFTHLRGDAPTKGYSMLLTVILAAAIKPRAD